eukprot:scaffold1261_cov50-Cyclotella_meneghiniana.AAC.7
MATAVTTVSQHAAPSATTDKLLLGIDEAMNVVDVLLEKSFAVREQFVSQIDSALTSYQLEMGLIDDEYDEQTSSVHSRRKKISAQTNHSLNYHLAKDSCRDGTNVFMLPSEDNEHFEVTELIDDGSQISTQNNLNNTTREASNSAGSNTAQLKHASRSDLLNKIETYRHEEEILLKRLADAVTDDGMTSNLTLRERQELQDDLERCRAKQAEEIVVSVNQYQPKMKKKVRKNGTSGNLHTQSIEQILADALNDSRSIASRSPRVIKAKSSIQSNRSKRVPNSVKTATTKLLLNSTNGRKTEQAVLEDSDHFLAVHELAIQSGESKASKRSLIGMVKSNTRPLNPLEIGRRNRVDRVRR